MAEVKAIDKKPPSMNEIGASGTTLYGGLVSDEYLSELKTLKTRCETYDKMRRSDGPIHAACLALELPIQSAKYHTEPASDSDRDKEIAAFVNHCLMDSMSQSWPEFLEQALGMLQYGFSIFEKVWKTEDWVYGGKSRKSMVKIKKLAHRDQKTLQQWLFEGNSISGIEQYAQFIDGVSSTNKRVQIAIDSLLVFTNRKKGDNFEGISVLRTAHRPWKIRDKYYRIEGIGIERNAVGHPVIKEPPPGPNVTVTEKDREIAERIISRLRTHEEGGTRLPSGWDLDLKGGNYNAYNVQAAIKHQMVCIFISVLATFLLLGTDGQGGAYALSRDQSDFFVQSLLKTVNYILSVINKYLVRQLVDYNYSVTAYPSVVCDGIGAENQKQWAEIVAALAQASLVTPHDELQRYVASKMGLPEPPEKKDLPAPGAPAPDIGKLKMSEAFVTLSEAAADAVKSLSLDERNQVLGRPLTEKEKRLGLTEEHAYDLKEELDRTQEQFQATIRPIWEKMKDGLRVQLTAGVKPEELIVPYQDKYQATLKKTLLEMAEKGTLQVEKELGRTVDLKAPEDWAEEISAALAAKDCMDLKYFVRLEYANAEKRGEL